MTEEKLRLSEETLKNYWDIIHVAYFARWRLIKAAKWFLICRTEKISRGRGVKKISNLCIGLYHDCNGLKRWAKKCGMKSSLQKYLHFISFYWELFVLSIFTTSWKDFLFQPEKSEILHRRELRNMFRRAIFIYLNHEPLTFQLH